MADHGRVHPHCVHASNPYHECGAACLEKLGHGQGTGVKENRKSDNYKGIRDVGVVKKMDGERRGDPTCPKASNPYHNCDQFCPSRTAKSPATPGNKRQSENYKGVRDGGVVKRTDGERRDNTTCPKASNPYHSCDEFCPSRTPKSVNSSNNKKESGVSVRSRPKSPQVDSVSAAYTTNTPSPANNKKQVEPANSHSFSSSQKNSNDSMPANHSSEKKQLQTLGSLLRSESIMRDTPSDDPPPMGSFTCFAADKLEKQEQNEKVIASPKAVSNGSNDVAKTASVYGPLDFVFSGISRATDDSDNEESQSVISDSCVSVGKYNVRTNYASTLQSILDKYEDIAANCRLESASMRSYYLECLCTVVHDLQSSPFKQLTKSKIKEMTAALKDVESVGINVTWLRGILDKLMEGLELKSQHQSVEEAKTKCDRVLDATKKELESMTEDVAQKEKEIVELNSRIDETRARLSELEAELSKINGTILFISSEVEKFHIKSLVDKIL